MSRGSLLVALVVCGCSTIDRPDGWALETHGKVDPAYDVVLDPNVVHEITITIAASDYEAMQADLATLTAGRSAGMMRPARPSADGGVPQVPAGGGAAPAGGVMTDLLAGDPMYVPVLVTSDGHQWTHVGMRYKGNSSLNSSFTAGNRKLPFRLDFDYYEDQFPEIDDQRFYGFGKMTFASNFMDPSQIREALAAEMMRESGVHVARWAFYRVMLDVGSGPEYLGLYTAVEDPSDVMMDREFSGGEGNLYKPDGIGADFAVFDATGFEKKSNEEAADFTDVEAAIAALHADRSDAAAWRAELEATFDAPMFLRWLAINTTFDNWDVYGSASHNYYLYGDPAAAGRLVWIPWDQNHAFGTGRRGPMGAMGTTTTDPVASTFHTTVDPERWPLIGYLLADPEYQAIYRAEIRAFVDGPFAAEPLQAHIDALRALVEADALAEVAGSTTTSAEGFAASYEGSTGVAAIADNRRNIVTQALATNGDGS